MKFNNKVYDTLKYIALVALPALATLCISLGHIWGFEHCDQIAGTITALDACLGVLLGLSSANYNKSVEGGGK